MRSLILALGIVAIGCGGSTRPPESATQKKSIALTDAPSAEEPAEITAEAHIAEEACGGEPLTVHFYDAGQALAALVELPGGQRLLVDTGESASRPGCGQPCKDWSKRVLDGLAEDVGEERIDVMWITHQHSDHLGNAVKIIETFNVGTYVHNGTDLTKPMPAAAVNAATKKGVPIVVVDPGHRDFAFSTPEEIKLTPILPTTWSCSNPNNCSIALRIDYCQSSILFVGDAEDEAEEELEVRDVTLLQVGHHGSDTSSSQHFIDHIKPQYAVISSGKLGEGTNRTYCHPRKSTVDRLTASTGGLGTRTLKAFDATVKCTDATPANWINTPTSDRVWATPRDGTVTLVTTGDGVFSEAAEEAGFAPCCRTCQSGKPCGDSCISKDATCKKPPGCACASEDEK